MKKICLAGRTNLPEHLVVVQSSDSHAWKREELSYLLKHIAIIVSDT